MDVKPGDGCRHLAPVHVFLLLILPRPQIASVCHLPEEQSLPPGGRGEQASCPCSCSCWAGARAGGAARWLAESAPSALLCLKPLPPDGPTDGPRRPGLLTGQQPRLVSEAAAKEAAGLAAVSPAAPPPPSTADMP